MFNLEFFFNVLSLGSLYALIALGLVIVYGILQLVNFAYGELIMVGGYAMFLLSTSDTHVPWSLIVVATSTSVESRHWPRPLVKQACSSS